MLCKRIQRYFIFVIPYWNQFCQKIPAHQAICKFHLRIRLYSLQWWEAQFGDNKRVAYEYKSHFLQLSHSLNWSFSLLYCKALNSYFFAVRQYGYPVFNAPERLHASINFNPCTYARLIIRLISFCTELKCSSIFWSEGGNISSEAHWSRWLARLHVQAVICAVFSPFQLNSFRCDVARGTLQL